MGPCRKYWRHKNQTGTHAFGGNALANAMDRHGLDARRAVYRMAMASRRPTNRLASNDQHMTIAAGIARNLFKQVPARSLGQTIMPENNAAAAWQGTKGRPKIIAHALVCHQPDMGQVFGVAAAHGCDYSGGHV